MTDFLLLEEISKMTGSMKKPRLMHRKGICAKGYFRPYISLSDYTRAEIYGFTDRAVDVIVRFSSMLGGEGTADTRRNIKGLSVRFGDGNKVYDLICQSLPVYFINDERKFPQLHKAFSCESSFDGINREKLWEFAVENRESINCILRLYSRFGLSRSFVDIIMYSVNTYIWRNNQDRAYLVRYKWVPANREKSGLEENRRVNNIFAEFMAGFDPHIATDEFITAVNKGKFPEYELYVQLIDYKYITDSSWVRKTLCWDEQVVRFFPVGIMKLTDVFTEGDEGEEQLSFSPDNLVDGIELCGDSFTSVMACSHKIGGYMRGVSI